MHTHRRAKFQFLRGRRVALTKTIGEKRIKINLLLASASLWVLDAGTILQVEERAAEPRLGGRVGESRCSMDLGDCVKVAEERCGCVKAAIAIG